MVEKLIKYGALALAALALYFVVTRLTGNPKGLLPLPYALSPASEGIQLDAPVLIVGDRMGARFGLFKENLALNLSVGLSKPIQIQSIAREGFGLHRTLRQLQSLVKWPKVLLYQGGSEEFREIKFRTDQIPVIRHNFDLYTNDRAMTAMMVWPFLSRLIYTPVQRIKLGDQVGEASKKIPSDYEYQQRLELTYRIYELELLELVKAARENKSLLILITAPVNLDVAPRRTCSNAGSALIDREVKQIREKIRNQDYKGAYAQSKVLNDGTLANAEVLYLHGQVAYRSGFVAEAVDSLKKASAYDCEGWRANEVINSIIRKVAQEQRVTLFDFAAMMDRDWNVNVTFFDEFYPQNLYYEKAMKYLAVVLKRILKL